LIAAGGIARKPYGIGTIKMATGKLKRFDIQANIALTLALVSAVPFVGAMALAIRNYDGNLVQITYGSGSKFAPLLLGCLLLSMAPGFVGFLLGLNSAGQRRNEKSNRSWMGFFIGGLVLTLDFILLLAFWKLRFEIPLG